MNPLRYFLNEWLLLGALLAAVPVILHFFHRSRYRVEPWGAMMFLRQSLEMRARKIRFQHLLLLALRALFFVLLALALARPVLNPERAAQKQELNEAGERQSPPTTHVLVLDASYSLQQGGDRTNLFNRVQRSALRLVQRMNEHDNMLIVRAGQRPRALINTPSSDRALLRRKLQEMEPGHERADLLLACRKAMLLLRDARKVKQRIYILTDRQAASWQGAQDHVWDELERHCNLLKIEPQIYVWTHQPDRPPHNTLIRRIYSSSPIIDVFRINEFVVEIENHGAATGARVDFYAGGELVGEREIGRAHV